MPLERDTAQDGNGAAIEKGRRAMDVEQWDRYVDIALVTRGRAKVARAFKHPANMFSNMVNNLGTALRARGVHRERASMAEGQIMWRTRAHQWSKCG